MALTRNIQGQGGMRRREEGKGEMEGGREGRRKRGKEE